MATCNSFICPPTEDHKTNPKTSQTEGESDEEFQTPLATPPGTPPPEKEVDVKGQERPCDIVLTLSATAVCECNYCSIYSICLHTSALQCLTVEVIAVYIMFVLS